ncbi:MAG: Hsp70 family protein, partial [Planctomycetota bacterium]
GTGKETEITCQNASGLPRDEIEKMARDAESHAEEDKHKRELAEARNQADSMCWQLEKLLKEHDAKLSSGDKSAVNQAIEKTKTAAKGDNLEAIKSAVRELEQASHALSKALYAQAGGQTPPPEAGPHPTGAPSAPGDDDTIDAEFEVKK